MKKILKGIGLFIVALFMVFSSLTTPVEAMSTTNPNYGNVSVKYYYGTTVKKTEYYRLHAEDINITGDWTRVDITVTNDNFVTGQSIIINSPINQVFLYANGKTLDYNPQSSKAFIQFRNTTNSQTTLYVNGGTFNVNADKGGSLVSNFVEGVQAKNEEVKFINSKIYVKGTTERANAVIRASRINLQNTIIDGSQITNGDQLYYAVYPYGSFPGYVSATIDNSTIKNFYAGLNLNHCDATYAAYFKNTVTFSNNKVDIYRMGKQLNMASGTVVNGSSSNVGTTSLSGVKALKIYDTNETSTNGSHVTVWTNSKINIESVNPAYTNGYYESYGTNNYTHAWNVGNSFDPTKVNYTNNNSSKKGSSTLTAGDTKYTLTMTAVDMILDANATTGDYTKVLAVSNTIPNTSYTLEYKKKADGDTEEYTGAVADVSALTEGDYQVTLRLTKTDGKTYIPGTVDGEGAATITKTFKVYKNEDVTLTENSTYKVENNVIEVKPSEDKDDIYLITLEPINEKPYVLAKNNTKLPNGTTLNYSWTSADGSKSGEGLPTEPGTYTITGTLKKDGKDVTDASGNVVKITTTITIPQSDNTGELDPDDKPFDVNNATVSADGDSITATDGTNKISINFKDPINPKYTGESIDMSEYVTDEITSVLGGSITYTYEGVNGTTYGPSNTAPSNIGTYKVTLTYTDNNGNIYTITKEITISPSSDDSLNDKSCKSSKGSNYAWSSKKQACVYKVTNTASD